MYNNVQMYKDIFSDLCSSGNATQYSLFLMKYSNDIQKIKHSDKFLGDHKWQEKVSKEINPWIKIGFLK